jgi:hypothetical protein
MDLFSSSSFLTLFKPAEATGASKPWLPPEKVRLEVKEARRFREEVRKLCEI